MIDNILKERYGVTCLKAPSEAILWACCDSTNPVKALKKINQIRAKAGAPLVYAPYGHPAF